MMNENVSKFIQYDGSFAIRNILEAVRFALYVNKESETVENIFKLSEISTISIEEFIACLEGEMSNCKILQKMKRSPSALSASVITWPYYAMYWALLHHRENVFNLNDTKTIIITRIAIEFHYYYLRYMVCVDEKSRINKKSIEYAAIVVTRIIELLSYMSKHRNAYCTEVYFDLEVDDPIHSFIDIVINDYVEKDCFFIQKDPKSGELFLKYENSMTNMEFQFLPSRKIQVGRSNGDIESLPGREIKNQKIKDYLIDGVVDLDKLKNLEHGRGQGKHRENRGIGNIDAQRECASLRIEDVLIIPDQYKQRRINMAFSAKKTKDNLLLQSAYDVPPQEIMMVFLQELCCKKFDEMFLLDNLFVFVFIMGISTGMNYEEVIFILLEEKTKHYMIDSQKKRLTSFLNAYHFGKEYAGFSISNLEKITFELPTSLISLFLNIQYKVKDLSDEEKTSLLTLKPNYKKFIGDKIDSTSVMLSIDVENLWKVILTYQSRELNMSSLFCISKYTTQIRSTLSYGSTHKSGQVHSTFLRNMYHSLKIDALIYNLILGTYQGTSPSESMLHDLKYEYSGAKRVVAQEDIKKFFSLLQKELRETNDEIKYFNLYSLYSRYALGLLLATRHYSGSCKLDRVSHELSFLTITEKSDSAASGIRVIPLTARAKMIIIKYQNLASSLRIKIDNIFFIKNEKTKVLNNTNRKEMVDLLKIYKVDQFVIDFTESVWLNYGRHIITKVAMEKRFDFTYLQTLLGHYSKGCEQHGIVSTLNEKDWHTKCIKLIDDIGNLYGI